VLPESAIAAAAVACSFVVEAIAVPRAALCRPIVAVSLHVVALAVVAGASTAITGRPLFSMAIATALIVLLAVVSNAKFESLRESFVFTDMSLFSQALSHPRLYLPFLGIGKMLAVLVVMIAAVAGFLAEAPIEALQRSAVGLIAMLCLPVCVALSRHLPLSLDPLLDQRRIGFFAAFVAYVANGLARTERRAFARATEKGPFASGDPLAYPDTHPHPDVIVIQSESYFDARRLGGCVMSGPYANLDRIRREAFAQGRLTVPAWGANTMRSEFSMLTGLPMAALGYARFYPYWYVRRACASVAGWFKRGGYRTLAVHPYYADFFGRNRAFRLMNFDRFLDIKHFAGATRVGPYVGDVALADALIALLQQHDDKPVFAFAITMENHGPLHLEQVAQGESHGRHTLGEDARWRDLTAYLRHIENADRMLAQLIDYLRKRERPAVLCFYGDHVPALGSVFDALGTVPTHSDYFIWRNFEEDSGEQRDVGVEHLGMAIQRAMIRKGGIGASSRIERQQAPA
jgi:phosphoglycerol transferase MdoB-like AlkP superfamily enzyme